MNYALVFRPEVREEINEAYSWYESQKSRVVVIAIFHGRKDPKSWQIRT